MLYNSFKAEKNAEFWQQQKQQQSESKPNNSPHSANIKPDQCVKQLSNHIDPNTAFNSNISNAALHSAALLHLQIQHQQQQQQQANLVNQHSLFNAQEYLFQLSRENPLFLAELLTHSNHPTVGNFMNMPGNFHLLHKAALAAAAVAANLPKQHSSSTNQFSPAAKKQKSAHSTKQPVNSLNSPTSSVSSSSPNTLLSSGSYNLNEELSATESNQTKSSQPTIGGGVKRPYLKFSMDSILAENGNSSETSVKSSSCSSSSSSSSSSSTSDNPGCSSKKLCTGKNEPAQEMNINRTNHMHQQMAYRMPLNYANGQPSTLLPSPPPPPPNFQHHETVNLPPSRSSSSAFNSSQQQQLYSIALGM